VRSRFNSRLLVLTLLFIVAGVGAAVAVLWWRTQPAQLLKSAGDYFTKGEEALNVSDRAAARTNFQAADNQLRNFLEKKNNPNDKEEMAQLSQALLQRHKVLHELALLEAAEETSRNDRDPNRLSLRMESTSRDAAFKAAALDPDNFEAQTVALNLHFAEEDFGAAANGENVLRLADQNTTFPLLENYLHGAHYALARRALTNQRPDVALEHLQASAELQKKHVEKGETPAPRWRAIALEMEARRMSVELARQVKPKPGARPTPKAINSEAERLQQEYNARLEEGLARVSREATQEAAASQSDPARPVLAALSASDARGLFAFLGRALAEAPDREEAQHRVDLAVEVCRKIVVGSPTEAVLREPTKFPALRESARFAATLPGMVARLPDAVRPPEVNQPVLVMAVERITADALQAGIAVDPASYVQMAENFGRTNPEQAMGLVRKGLEAAEAARLPAMHEIVMNLHQKAAWWLLVLGQNDEAEKHLAALGKEKQTTALAHLIRGEVAVLDGRLEQGARELEKARDGVGPYYRPILYSTLAHAYLGLARYPKALEALGKVEASLKNPEKLTAEQQGMMARMVNPQGLLLEMLRCYLGMGRLDKALEVREQLKSKEIGKEADFLVVQVLLASGRQRLTAGKTDEAAKVYAAARRIVEEARRLYPDDPNLFRAEVDLVLSEPAAISAVPYLALGSAAHAAPAIPQVAKAEALVRDFAFAKKELPRMVVWVQWLEITGRLGEANDVLTRLEEKDFPDQKQSLQLERFQLLQRLGQTTEAARLIKQIQQRPDLPTGQGVYFDVLVNDFSRAQGRIDAALSKHESQGQTHYWQGVVAQGRGDHEQAVKAFERSLQYAAFKANAQMGLTVSLLAWAGKAPDDALKEAGRLAKAHRDDPMVLLAYAQVARLAGDLYGDAGMEGALHAATGVLARTDAHNPMGHYAAAKLWMEIGRPDKARPEVQAALAINGQHAESLILSGQLAQDAGDWAELARLADALESARPSAVEAVVWHGLALENQEQPEEARKLYEMLMDKAPNLAGGYFSLAALKERAKDYAGALDVLARCAKVAPADANVLGFRVRLLALAGKADEGLRLAEAFIRDNWVRRNKEFDELELRQPAQDEQEKAKRYAAHAQAGAKEEKNELLIVARELGRAGAFDQAEPCVIRALKFADGTTAKTDAARARSIAAGYYLNSGQQRKDKVAIDRAIDLYGMAWKDAPGDALAGNNLAFLLATERKDGAAAAAIIDRLRQGRPGAKPLSGDQLSPPVLDTACVAYLEAGKSDEALRLLQEARKRYKDEPRVFINLGRCYARLKDTSKALVEFNKGIDLAGRKAQTVRDEDSKARLLQLAATARDERDAMERR
jgi:Tfp pilus assembly protein PilF